jgi:hypothetical protein
VVRFTVVGPGAGATLFGGACGVAAAAGLDDEWVIAPATAVARSSVSGDPQATATASASAGNHRTNR